MVAWVGIFHLKIALQEGGDAKRRKGFLVNVGLG
jgi:hypothetical protein